MRAPEATPPAAPTGWRRRVAAAGWCGAGLATLLAAGYALVAYAPARLAVVPRPQHLESLRSAAFAVQLHAGSGGLALLLALAIFGLRWRDRGRRLHGPLGYAYCIAVCVSASAGLWLARLAEGGWAARMAFALLALLWLATTSASVVLALDGQYRAHRQAAVHSAALAFAGVSLRLQLPVALALGIDFATAYPVIAWTCWVPNLVWADWWLRRHGR